MAFFSFFRKSNLLIQSAAAFDPRRHLRRCDVRIFKWGILLFFTDGRKLFNTENAHCSSQLPKLNTLNYVLLPPSCTHFTWLASSILTNTRCVQPLLIASMVPYYHSHILYFQRSLKFHLINAVLMAQSTLDTPWANLWCPWALYQASR